jgi:23S rRNA pseudouridine1911/1915/1917 synthase
MKRPLSGLDILFEDNHCLAIAKPAGAVSAHFQGSETTLDRAVKAYLKQKYHKPGNVYLGVVHRLDRPVSGVLLFARTSKAAARLSEQFREGRVQKVYWAVVEGQIERAQSRLEGWLLRDEASGRMVVTPVEEPGARAASLHFQVLGGYEPSGTPPARALSLLEVLLETGRRHQIRAQLAGHGHPIYGDAKYGSAHRFGRAIALHARSLAFEHPVRRDRITLTARFPGVWRHHFGQLFPALRGRR